MPEALTFAVVIPTHDRRAELHRCLESLAVQNYPSARFEVIVVDDGSPVPVDDVVAHYRPRLNLTFRRQIRAGPAAARNHGATVARSRFLSFLDDDCRADPDWLLKLERAFATHPQGHVLGGRVRTTFADNLPNWVSELILQVIVERYQPAPGGIYFFRTTNLAVRLDEFQEAGGFDPRFRTAEDREFCDRWLHRGGALAYAPDATVMHDKHLSVRGFAALHFHYGAGAYRFHRIRRQRRSGRFRPAFLKYYGFVLQAALADRSHSATPKLALLALWQLSNAAGFLHQMLRHQFRGSLE